MNEYMTAKDWGDDTIQIEAKGVTQEYRPTELHFKKTGTIDEKPSLAIVMDRQHSMLQVNQRAYGQISLSTLKDCLNQLGYDIVPLNEQTSSL